MKFIATKEGIEFQAGGGDKVHRDVTRWTRVRMFAWPDNLYRAAARKIIRDLLAENRRLRHGWQPRMSLYGLALTWIDRKYPTAPLEPPVEIDTRRRSA